MPDLSTQPNDTSPFPLHTLPMRGTIFLEYIMSGKKKYESRVNGSACRVVRVGDHLQLLDRQAGWGIVCEVTSKDAYQSFEGMLRAKGVLTMLPQLERAGTKQSTEELLQKGLRIYQAFPGAYRAKNQGVVAIGVRFIHQV